MTDFEQKRIFADNLSKLLEAHNKSQREVAAAIDVSPQTFNTWCQGIALPRMGKVQKLADYFHIRKSDLIDPPSAPAAARTALTPDRQELLADYDLLNKEGQQEARKQVHNLTRLEEYTRAYEQDTAHPV